MFNSITDVVMYLWVIQHKKNYEEQPFVYWVKAYWYNQNGGLGLFLWIKKIILSQSIAFQWLVVSERLRIDWWVSFFFPSRDLVYLGCLIYDLSPRIAIENVFTFSLSVFHTIISSALLLVCFRLIHILNAKMEGNLCCVSQRKKRRKRRELSFHNRLLCR